MQVLRGLAAAEGARRRRKPRLGDGAHAAAPRASRRANAGADAGCVLKVHEDRAVMRAHREALEPLLGDGPTTLAAGGYSLDTDFGFGSVSSPRR